MNVVENRTKRRDKNKCQKRNIIYDQITMSLINKKSKQNQTRIRQNPNEAIYPTHH